MAVVTTVKELGVPSTSVVVKVPVAVGVPAMALELASLPASITVPALVPPITAASFLPSIVTLTTWAVPSAAVTVKVSVRVPPATRACTALLVLSSV